MSLIQSSNTPSHVNRGTLDDLDDIQDSMAFFTGDTEVTKENVKEEDKPIVDGLESIMRKFSSIVGEEKSKRELIATLDERVGSEDWRTNTRAVFSMLLQLAKDVASFILSLIYNRIKRLDTRCYKAHEIVKTNGLIPTEVNVPAYISKVLVNAESTKGNPKWIEQAILDVNGIYESMMAANKLLLGWIPVGAGFDEDRAVKEVTTALADVLTPRHDGVQGFRELPGNQRLVVNILSTGRTDKIPVYIESSDNQFKLNNPKYIPNKHVIDSVITTVERSISTMRKYQAAPNDLVRAFERETAAFRRRSGYKLTARHESFLNWIIRLNKRVCGLAIKQMFNVCEAALDYCERSAVK